MAGSARTRGAGYDRGAILLYAAGSGAAFGVLYIFAGYLSDNLSLVTWIVLLLGTLAAVALTAWGLFRFLVSQTVSNSLSEPAREIWQNVKDRPGDPVSALDRSATPISQLAVRARNLAVFFVAFTVILGLVAEITLLTTAAVGYLQAERLREQNVLLNQQTTAMEVQLLKEATESSRTFAEQIIEKERARDILDDMVPTLSRFQRSRRHFGLPEAPAWEILLCPGDRADCDTIRLEDLAEHFEGSVSLAFDAAAAASAAQLAVLHDVLALVQDLIEFREDFSFSTEMQTAQDMEIAIDQAFSDRLVFALRTCSNQRFTRFRDLSEELEEIGAAGFEIHAFRLGDASGPGALVMEAVPPIDDIEDLQQVAEERRQSAFVADGAIVFVNDPSSVFLSLSDSAGDLAELMGAERPEAVGIQSFYEILSAGLEAFAQEGARLIAQCDAEIADIQKAREAMSRQFQRALASVALRSGETD